MLADYKSYRSIYVCMHIYPDTFPYGETVHLTIRFPSQLTLFRPDIDPIMVRPILVKRCATNMRLWNEVTLIVSFPYVHKLNVMIV